MFTPMREREEKKEKNLTYCTDCHSVIEVEAERNQWVKCPHCKLQFRFTQRVVRKS